MDHDQHKLALQPVHGLQYHHYYTVGCTQAFSTTITEYCYYQWMAGLQGSIVNISGWLDYKGVLLLLVDGQITKEYCYYQQMARLQVSIVTTILYQWMARLQGSIVTISGLLDYKGVLLL